MAEASTIQLRNCMMRPYQDGDVQSLSKAADSPNTARWMSNAFPQPYTLEAAKAWISIASGSSPVRDLAICLPDGSTVIGGIGLKARADIYYRTMVIGYWLSEDYCGRGIATEAVVAFSDWAFERFPHLLRLEAEVFDGNVASGRVLEKAGFEFEARQKKAVEKFGVILDTLTYCRFREGP